MKRLFIFANSFIAHTFILSSEYIFYDKIYEIVLLSENYNELDFSNIISNIHVRCFDTLDECMHYCDIALLCINSNMPIKKINYVRAIGTQLNKKIILLNTDWDDTKKDDMIEDQYIDIDITSHIIVANIAMSESAQQFYLEILLNRFMSERQIAFKQLFSPRTLALLVQLEKNGVLNSNLCQQLQFKKLPYDVAIIGVSLCGIEHPYNIAFEKIKEISPDYVILQSDIKFNDFDHIEGMLKYRCNTCLDMIIKSHYIQIENNIKFNVHCNCNIDTANNILDLESKNIKDNLAFNMLSKLALPEGIVRI